MNLLKNFFKLDFVKEVLTGFYYTMVFILVVLITPGTNEVAWTWLIWLPVGILVFLSTFLGIYIIVKKWNW